VTDVIDLDPFQTPGPFPADTSGSYPTLLHWDARRIGSDIHLTGIVLDHPRLPNGAIQTSALCEIACDRSWARTLNTLYLLGAAATEKAAENKPLPLLLRLLLADDWLHAAKIAVDATMSHRSLLDKQAYSDFIEIWINADAMPLHEGQRRAGAIHAAIADGVMPHSVVDAWQALAAETSSPDTCAPTARAGSAAYDRWYARAEEDETAKLLHRNLAGWRCLADDDRSPLNGAEPDQFKLAMTLGDMCSQEEGEQEEMVIGAGPLGALRKLEPATAPQTRPGLVVIRAIGGNTLTSTGREVHSEFQKLIGVTMPLAPTPDLTAARQILASEFPHCIPAIEAILGDLTGPTIKWRSSLFVGPAAVGKSRLANRLPAVLGMPEPSRFDGAGASDNAFGGTPRRWSTGEASAPLEAVRRSGVANPCFILDNVERAATSRHNGRFSDSLLPFLCAETSRVHFDPFLESPANLSAINYIATANNELDLPKELRDRFRLLRIPEPSAEHLPALARTLAREIAAERGIAPKRGIVPEWVLDLDSFEIDVASRLWRGGSIRRLRAIVEIIISKRDELAMRH
jgi:ATP-dependent Lon protease